MKVEYVTQEYFNELVKNNSEKVCKDVDTLVSDGEFDIYRKYEDWCIIDNVIYVVDKCVLTFDKLDYLKSPTTFIPKLKKLYRNCNNPYHTGFGKVELALVNMVEKGNLAPEEVKNQIGEAFPELLEVFVEAYSKMTGQNETLKDLFDTFNEKCNIKTSHILPFVEDIITSYKKLPEFKFDSKSMDELSNSKEFKFISRHLQPFLEGISEHEGNYLVDKNALVVLVGHIITNSIIENECNPMFNSYFLDMFSKYREIFNITGDSVEDEKELRAKMSVYAANYNNFPTRKVFNGELIPNTVYQGWYDCGYVLGSPQGSKLF